MSRRVRNLVFMLKSVLFCDRYKPKGGDVKIESRKLDWKGEKRDVIPAKEAAK